MSAPADAGPTIFHVTVGEGLPVVVVHGGLGLDHTYLLPALEPLAGECRLTFVDLRGNGRSPVGMPWSEVTRERWAEDLDEVRAALGYERFVLFGHSYGGFVAQDYAFSHADRLSGLVLCCTAPALDYPDVIAANLAARGTPEQQALFAEALSGSLCEDRRLGEIWMGLLPLYFRQYMPAYVRAFDRAQYRAAAFNHSFLAVPPTTAPMEALARLDVPALVLAGRHDWITPPREGAERLAAALPDAELHVFEESGHCPFFEEAGPFLEVLSAWLRRHAPSTTLWQTE